MLCSLVFRWSRSWFYESLSCLWFIAENNEAPNYFTLSFDLWVRTLVPQSPLWCVLCNRSLYMITFESCCVEGQAKSSTPSVFHLLRCTSQRYNQYLYQFWIMHYLFITTLWVSIFLVLINDENKLSLWWSLEPHCSRPVMSDCKVGSIHCVFPCCCFSMFVCLTLSSPTRLLYFLGWLRQSGIGTLKLFGSLTSRWAVQLVLSLSFSASHGRISLSLTPVCSTLMQST